MKEMRTVWIFIENKITLDDDSYVPLFAALSLNGLKKAIMKKFGCRPKCNRIIFGEQRWRPVMEENGDTLGWIYKRKLIETD